MALSLFMGIALRANASFIQAQGSLRSDLHFLLWDMVCLLMLLGFLVRLLDIMVDFLHLWYLFVNCVTLKATQLLSVAMLLLLSLSIRFVVKSISLLGFSSTTTEVQTTLRYLRLLHLLMLSLYPTWQFIFILPHHPLLLQFLSSSLLCRPCTLWSLIHLLPPTLLHLLKCSLLIVEF